MRQLQLIGAMLGVSFLVSSSQAFTGAPAKSSCQRMMRLVVFVYERTAYEQEFDCPRVKWVSGSELSTSVTIKWPTHFGEPMAMFQPDANVILLSHEIDLSNSLGRSYLVHELVHALQIAGGVASEVRCIGWLEAEAYRVQADYLRQEEDEKEAFRIEVLGLLQGACANAYHPDYMQSSDSERRTPPPERR